MQWSSAGCTDVLLPCHHLPPPTLIVCFSTLHIPPAPTGSPHKRPLSISRLLQQVRARHLAGDHVGPQRRRRLQVSTQRGRHALHIHPLQLAKPLHDALDLGAPLSNLQGGVRAAWEVATGQQMAEGAARCRASVLPASLSLAW